MKLPIFLTFVSRALASIVFTISSQPFQPQCVNNQLTLFGLNMNVQVSIDGGPLNQPMAETGLPDINMYYFINGQPIQQVNVLNSFNIANSNTQQNIWTFTLLDDQPNIGGSIQLAQCVQGMTYAITASFSSNTFINGVGFPSLNIPAASGIPTIINNLSPQNTPGATITTTIPTATKTTTTIPTMIPTTTKTTKTKQTTTLSPSTSPTSTSPTSTSQMIDSTTKPQTTTNSGNNLNKNLQSSLILGFLSLILII